MRCYCYASGLIAFGRTLPEGALPIASGPPKALRAFIEAHARHGYRTRIANGRPTKIPDSDMLLVPGAPEAPDQAAALDALQAWCRRIGQKPPVGVTMSHGAVLAGVPVADFSEPLAVYP